MSPSSRVWFRAHGTDGGASASDSLLLLTQVAKIYVSVIGEERDQEMAMEGLRAAAGHVRTGLGRRMRLRFAPEVRFIQDDSIERGSKVSYRSEKANAVLSLHLLSTG